MRGSKRTWKCNKGCKLTEEPCEHLEKLLPKEGSGCFKPENSIYRNMENLGNITLDWGTGAQTEEGLRLMLEKHHMLEHEIEVLVERFVHNRTFKQIKEDLGFTAISAVFGVYQQSLTKLRSKIERKA
jgi:hypothetical protein